MGIASIIPRHLIIITNLLLTKMTVFALFDQFQFAIFNIFASPQNIHKSLEIISI